jgi:ParB/RepB/Spo0J family partition protein
MKIEVTKIEPIPELTREVYPQDKFKLLKDDIRKHGLSNPIHVIKRERNANNYYCFMGNHRLRVHKELAKDSPKFAYIEAIVEDIPREEAVGKGFRDGELTVPYNPMDTCNVISELSKGGKSYSEIACLMFGGEEHLSKVKQMARLKKLPISVQNRVKEGKIEWSKAILLRDLEDDDKIEEAAEETIDEDYTWREVQDLVKNDGFGAVKRLTDRPPRGLQVRCYECGILEPYERTKSRQICDNCLKNGKGTSVTRLTDDSNLVKRLTEPRTLAEYRAAIKNNLGKTVTRLTVEPYVKDTTWAKGLDPFKKEMCIKYSIQKGVTLREAREFFEDE